MPEQAEQCKVCKKPVRMMVQKGTGLCSQKCKREYPQFAIAA